MKIITIKFAIEEYNQTNHAAKATDQDAIQQLTAFFAKLPQENLAAELDRTQLAELYRIIFCPDFKREHTSYKTLANLRYATNSEHKEAIYTLLSADLFDQNNLPAVISHEAPKKLAHALLDLKKEKILTKEIQEAVLKHRAPDHVAAILRKLSQIKLLDKYMNAVLQHNQLKAISSCLGTLYNNRLFTEKNLVTVLTHDQPEIAEELIRTLDYQGLLTDDLRTTLFSRKDLNSTLTWIKILNDNHLLSNSNLELLISHANPEAAAEALKILRDASILSKIIREKVLRHGDPVSAARAMHKLEKAGLLDDATSDLAMKQDTPSVAAQAMITLKENELFEKYAQEIQALDDPINVASTLALLKRNNLLTADLAQQILTHKNVYRVYLSLLALTCTMLTNEHIQAILRSDDPESVTNILFQIEKAGAIFYENRLEIFKLNTFERIFLASCKLNQAKILTTERLVMLMQNPLPVATAEILCLLQSGRVLSNQYQKMVFNHARPRSLAKALIRLGYNNLLSPQYIHLVLEHKEPKMVAKGLERLSDNNLLTEDNINLIVGFENPDNASNVLILLNQNQLFSVVFFEKIVKDRFAVFKTSTLCQLKNAGILTPTLQQLVLDYDNPEYLDEAVADLKQGGRLTEKNCTYLLQSSVNPAYLSSEMCTLQNQGVLHESYYDEVFKHANPGLAINAIRELKENKELTNENRRIVMSYDKPDAAAKLLCYLKSADLFSEEYLHYLVTHKEMTANYLEICNHLSSAGIFTKENIERLLNRKRDYSFAGQINTLKKANVLTSDIFQYLVNFTNYMTSKTEILCEILKAKLSINDSIKEHLRICNPWNKKEICQKLAGSRLLTLDTLEIVLKDAISYDYKIDEMIGNMHDAGLLTKDNLDAVFNYSHPPSALTFLKKLNKAGISTPENRQAILNHTAPDHATDALCALQKEGILSDEYRDIILDCQDPGHYHKILACLHKNGFKTMSANLYNAIFGIKHIDNYEIEDIIHDLQQANLISEQILISVFQHRSPVTIKNAFCELQPHSQFTSAHRDLVYSQENPLLAAKLISKLINAGIDISHHFETIIKHHDPDRAADALINLNKNNLLVDDYIRLVFSENQPTNVADLLIKLKIKNLLTNENAKLALALDQPGSFIDALDVLKTSGVLTTETRDAVIRLNMTKEQIQSIFHDDVKLTAANFKQFCAHKAIFVLARSPLSSIPGELYTQDMFDQLVQLFAKANGKIMESLDGVHAFIDTTLSAHKAKMHAKTLPSLKNVGLFVSMHSEKTASAANHSTQVMALET